MREIDFLKAALHTKVQAALKEEYGSLENALAYFRERFGDFAPRIMAETHPEFLDPIVLRTLDGRGFNFFSEYARCPWSVSNPRPGSMAEFLAKREFLAATADEKAGLCLAGAPGEIAAKPKKILPKGRNAGQIRRQAN